MKDYLGDAGESQKREGYTHNKNRTKQGGNFYSESKGDKKEFNKPVFNNSIRPGIATGIVSQQGNDEAYGSIRNNNTEYTKKNNFNSNYGSDRGDNRYEKQNRYGKQNRNDGERRPQFNNSNGNFNNNSNLNNLDIQTQKVNPM